MLLLFTVLPALMFELLFDNEKALELRDHGVDEAVFAAEEVAEEG